MKNARLLFIAVFLLGMGSLRGQMLEQRVTLRYTGAPLGEVLDDISRNYPVRFSYSPHFIPVGRQVVLNVANEPLGAALDQITRQVPVAYAEVGGQVLLKPDDSRQEQLGQLQTLKGKVRQTSPIYPSETEANRRAKAEKERIRRRMAPIDGSRPKVIKSGGDSYREVNLAAFYQPLPEAGEEKAPKTSANRQQAARAKMKSKRSRLLNLSANSPNLKQ